MIRTFSGYMPRACATAGFTEKGAWVLAHTVTFPFSMLATAVWVSMDACAT